MNAIIILATVVIRLASYGGGASCEGGDTEVETYKPGWLGRAPKDACQVSYDWRQLTDAGRCDNIPIT